jgi:outer membrane receptor protein involved in Fe transport
MKFPRLLAALFLLLLNQYMVQAGNITSVPLSENSERNGILKGKVINDKGEPLQFSNVVILENKLGTTTNASGVFEIVNIRPGHYTVKASFMGYKSETKKADIQAGETTSVSFSLISESFQIGSIEVVANSDFIPTEPETKTVISSGEIEHMQAASLGDVLLLSPGNALVNPDLNSNVQASIRGGSSLGAQIMVDGVPVSNNANMQIGAGNSTANSGIDMRAIPAENIEMVEVVRGIPSAQYGDLTDGLMIVKTRSKAAPLTAKVKYNPNVYEFNVSDGLKLGDNWVINGNFNLASSQRDIRIEGSGYTRYAGQLNTTYETEKYSLKNNFYFTWAHDEMKEQPGYALRTAWYNKDINIKYNGNYDIKFSSFSALSATTSLSYTKQDSYNQQLISRDNIVISDRTTEGSQDGRIVFGSYLGKEWVKGTQWNIFTDVNYMSRFFTGEILHSVMAGASWKDEFNKGEGIIFDPLYPPSLASPSPRIRKYSDLPDYNTVSLYTEDKITGRFYKPFTLNLGVRYEVYRPDGLKIKGLIGKGDLISSKNGSYLNPRVNFSMNIFEKTQLRLSYGVTTKSPTMGMIYSQDKYFDIIDTVSVVNPQHPDSNFSVVSTYVKKANNGSLKAYKQFKYEVSLDQQVGPVGFTITGFINNTQNMFRSLSIPTVFYKYSYANWPSQSQKVTGDTIMDTYSRYVNDGYSKVEGIEFAFNTSKIPVINTLFKFDAAYYYQRDGSNGGYFLGLQRFVDFLNMKAIPMYQNYESYSKNLLLNYRFEIQAESLGLWFTLHLQQQLIEIDGYNDYNNKILPIAYFTQSNEYVEIPVSERNSAKYNQLKGSVESFELRQENRPNKWLFNVKVSKSLWKSASVSFFVNNFLNNRPLYRIVRHADSSPSYEMRNPPIFYGMELNTMF